MLWKSKLKPVRILVEMEKAADPSRRFPNSRNNLGRRCWGSGEIDVFAEAF